MATIEDLLPLLGPVDARSANRRLSYGSFACLRRNYLFIETPKAACSTMKWVLAMLDGPPAVTPKLIPMETTLEMSIHYRNVHPVKHILRFSPEQARRFLTSDEIMRFCVVRNPYARFVSAWADKFRQMEPMYIGAGRTILKRNGVANPSYDDAPSFMQFADHVTRNQDANDCNHHWRQMTSLLFAGRIVYTYIVKVETMTRDLEPVFAKIAPEADLRALLDENRKNESLPVDWKSFYDEALAEKVWNFYPEDFKVYGYAKDSWRRAPEDRGPVSFESLEQAALKAIRARNELIFALYNQLQATERKT